MPNASQISYDQIISWYTIMLAKAEELFGVSDNTWTFSGVRFADDGPYIFYPHDSLRQQVQIVLNTVCKDDELRLKYQLAHEVCHTLYPTGHQDANVLNEGISTFFSFYYLGLDVRNHYYIHRTKGGLINGSSPAYYEAYLLLIKLLEKAPNAIRQIRILSPQISYVTKEQILSLGFALQEDEVDLLVSDFNRGKLLADCRVT